MEVKEQFNIGSREVYIAALKDGSIDLVPEYSGALLKYLDEKSTATTTEAVQAELATKLPEGISMLPSPAEDKDVLAVTKATADKYKLAKISDLARSRVNSFSVDRRNGRPASMVWSASAMCTDQFQGIRRPRRRRHLDDDGADQRSDSGRRPFQHRPGLVTNNLVALEDDKSLFAAENVVPLIKTAKLNDTVTKTLNDVSAKLTTEDLISMNAEAATGTNLSDIAKKWLAGAGISGQ